MVSPKKRRRWAQTVQNLRSMNHDNPGRTASRELNLKLVDKLAQCLDLTAYPLIKLGAGAQMAYAGDQVTRLPLLINGAADAFVHQMTDSGTQVMLVSWGAGEIMMLSYLFTRQALSADIEVAQEAAIRWLPIEVVEDCLQSNQELLILLVRFMALRLREVHARERSWLERGVHERVCATLARIIKAMPRLREGGVVLAATHESLAARCGVSRPRLSKELKKLEAADRVRLGRGTIEIIDTAWFDAMR